MANHVPRATATGIDSEEAILDVARRHASEVGVAVQFVPVDLGDGYEAMARAIGGLADVMWAGHVVYHAVDQ